MQTTRSHFNISDLQKTACARLNPHLFALKDKKKSKYGNRKTVVDGIEFDSEKEAKRYGELIIRRKAGEIGMLELQVVYELVVNGELVCKYEADFVYVEMATGEKIVEDVKSPATRKIAKYRLKKKLMKSIYGITISEV